MMQVDGLHQGGIPLPMWLEDEMKQHKKAILAEANFSQKKRKRAPPPAEKKKSRWPFSRHKKDSGEEVSGGEQYSDREEFE